MVVIGGVQHLRPHLINMAYDYERTGRYDNDK